MNDVTFTNPRLVATFDDWPIGGNLRGRCTFEVVREKKGWRIRRTTTNKEGEPCKPKLTTFSGPAAIVDGSDGKTYVLQEATGFVDVWGSDLKCPWTDSAVFKRSNPGLHAQLMALIVQGGAKNQTIV